MSNIGIGEKRLGILRITDGLLQESFNVIAAKAGIRIFKVFRTRACAGSDGFMEFCRGLG